MFEIFIEETFEKKNIAFLTEQFRNRRPNLSLIKGIIMTYIIIKSNKNIQTTR